ncbi:MAG: hypothetical protein F6K48_34670, partial [Okeania sp. SIO3H1]|nr:hypothetical protein [Okeania sp. SIO3H1]
MKKIPFCLVAIALISMFHLHAQSTPRVHRNLGRELDAVQVKQIAFRDAAVEDVIE